MIDADEVSAFARHTPDARAAARRHMPKRCSRFSTTTSSGAIPIAWVSKNADALRDRYRLLEKRRSPDARDTLVELGGRGADREVSPASFKLRFGRDGRSVVGLCRSEAFLVVGSWDRSGRRHAAVSSDGLGRPASVAYVDERNAASLGCSETRSFGYGSQRQRELSTRARVRLVARGLGSRGPPRD